MPCLHLDWNAILLKFLSYCWSVLTLTILCGLNLAIGQEQKPSEGQNDNGGFMEVSMTFAAFESRFVDAPYHFGGLLNIRLNYQWNGFFIEDKGLNGLGLPGLGYNFYNDQRWSFDIYLSEIYGEIATDDADTIGNEQRGLEGILPRNSDDRIGLRTTYYFDETSVLRVLVAPFSDLKNQDIHLAMWYGKSWQRYNTNFHAIFSAQYDGARTLDYFYGVTGTEVSDKFPAYQASSGFTLSAELGVTYPLAKDWVLESSIKLIRLPSSVAHSPLVDPQVESFLQFSLVYVLF